MLLIQRGAGQWTTITIPAGERPRTIKVQVSRSCNLAFVAERDIQIHRDDAIKREADDAGK